MKEKLSVELMLVIFDNKIRLFHLFLSFACIVQNHVPFFTAIISFLAQFLFLFRKFGNN
jgi:hypothetical protein